MKPAGQRWSWIAAAAIVALCGALGVLQYLWIGEVSIAERDRLQRNLNASLQRVSQDFNSDLTALSNAFSGDDYGASYSRWQETARHTQMLRGLYVARPEAEEVKLLKLNPQTKELEPVAWPANWTRMKERMSARLAGEPFRGGVMEPRDAEALIDVPKFGPDDEPGPGRFGRREIEWLLLDLDAAYLAGTVVPELIERHLGSAYPYAVLARDKRVGGEAITQPDATVAIFESQFEMGPRRGGGGGPPRPGQGFKEGFKGGRRPPPPPGGQGRWTLAVRHQAGSLEAVVNRTRLRNLGVTAAILALMLGTVGVLMRTTRQSQRLAEMQMDFVAGVSHELRTPLTVINTAAYNLRGRVAQNPAQVERYGTLIQAEAEKLTALVEQVLRYASAKAGRTIRDDKEPVAVEMILEEGLASSSAVLDGAGCTVEKSIAPGLPLILGDPLSLEHAVQNLLSNAAKYGTGWVGVFAEATEAGVEIRVADRGPGIPPDEQAHVFDAFFRGRQALQDQVHGTGLGLNLVKGIIEAHGGTITVKSSAETGTEFTIRIPAAPSEYQDEFTHSINRG